MKALESAFRKTLPNPPGLRGRLRFPTYRTLKNSLALRWRKGNQALVIEEIQESFLQDEDLELDEWDGHKGMWREVWIECHIE